jgi:hypothetical protein
MLSAVTSNIINLEADMQVLRRKFLGLVAAIPFLNPRRARAEQTPELDVPEETRQRIAKVLAEGGKIIGLSYYVPDPKCRIGGQLFFVKEEERDWRVKP